MQREAGPGRKPLSGFMGRALKGFCAKAKLVNSNQESGLLVSPMGVFSKGRIKGQPWEVGETVDHKGRWGSH